MLGAALSLSKGRKPQGHSIEHKHVRFVTITPTALTVIMFNMKTIAITIDNDTLNDLDRLLAAGAKGGTAGNRSRMIRDAVREYIRTRERATAEAREAAIIRRHRNRLTKQNRAAIREQAKP
jgi:hypothetical protein